MALVAHRDARAHDRVLDVVPWELSVALASAHPDDPLALSRPRPKSHDSYPRPGSIIMYHGYNERDNELETTAPTCAPLVVRLIARHLSTLKFITRRCALSPADASLFDRSIAATNFPAGHIRFQLRAPHHSVLINPRNTFPIFWINQVKRDA